MGGEAKILKRGSKLDQEMGSLKREGGGGALEPPYTPPNQLCVETNMTTKKGK